MKPGDMVTFERQWVSLCAELGIEDYYLVFLIKDGTMLHTATLGNINEDGEGVPVRRMGVVLRGVIGGLFDFVRKYTGFSRPIIAGMLRACADEIAAIPPKKTSPVKEGDWD